MTDKKVFGGNSVFCTRCGAKVMPGDRFCIPCGAPVTDLSSVLTGQNESPAEENFYAQKTDNGTDGERISDNESIKEDPVMSEAGEEAVKDNAIKDDDESQEVAENTVEVDVAFGTGGKNEEAYEKPLYGYEPYEYEKHSKQEKKPVLEERIKAVPPPAFTNPYVQANSPSGYAGQGAGYAALNYRYYPMNAGNRRNEVYTGSEYTGGNNHLRKAADKPQKNRTGIIIMSLIIVFIIGFLIQGIILNRMKNEIKNTIAEAFTGLNESKENNSTYSDTEDIPPSDNSQSEEKTGESPTYEGLIDEYFAMMSKGNPDAIIELLHPNVITALEKEGYKEEEYAKAVDAFTDYYGAKVDYYSIVGAYPYNNSDYLSLCDKLDIGKAEIKQYISVSVDADFIKDDVLTTVFIDFNLIKVSDRWYIVSVW